MVAKDFLDGGEGASGIWAFFVEGEVFLLLGLRNEPLFAGRAFDFGGLRRKGGARKRVSREKGGERVDFLLSGQNWIQCPFCLQRRHV